MPLTADIAGSTAARENLIGLDRDELAAELEAMGAPAYRAKQLWHWIYHRGARR